MSEIKRILFPLDFSSLSARALPHAVEAAHQFRAEVDLLHVCEPSGLEIENVEFQIQWIIERAPWFSDYPVNVRPVLLRARTPETGILDYILENEVDLTVMGTHSRESVHFPYLGSVAEKVLRYAGCPVLTVGHDAEGNRENPKYQVILTAFDFSDDAICALHNASQFARRYGARLNILHVIEQEMRPSYFSDWQKRLDKEIGEIQVKAREMLTETLVSEGIRDADIHVRSAVGRSDQEVLRFVREKNVGLLIMGAKGLSSDTASALGSIVERVVRAAPCPVLTFRAGPRH